MSIPAHPARSVAALGTSVYSAEAKVATADLIIGPYRSGKTLALLDQIIDYCQANPFRESIVLVPSRRYQQLLERRLHQSLQLKSAQSGKAGIVGLKVVNFQKLCELVLRRSGTAFRVIPQNVRPAIVSRCMVRLKEAQDLNHIAGMVNFTGTHQSVLDLIDEFERAALTPDDVIRRLEKTSQSDSRYMELARIYAAYKSELAQTEFEDEKGLAFRAREVLYSDTFKMDVGLIAVDGFDRFNSLQLQVLAGLARHSDALKICFDYLAPEADLLQEYVWKEASYIDLMKTLGANVSTQEMSGPTETSRQRIKFRAIDRQFEMEYIARQIKNGIIKEGRQPGDYLVVSRNIRSYRAAISSAFDSAGLNYFIDEAISLHALPLVQFLNKLFNLAANKFSRADTIAILSSPYFNKKNIGLTRRDIEGLDRASMRMNVVASRNQWEDVWHSSVDGPRPDARKILFRFFDIATPPSVATDHEFVRWVEDVIEACLIQPEPHLADELQREKFDLLEEQRALIEIRRLIASLIHEENILGAQEQSIVKLLGRLGHLIEKSNFRRTPRTANCVVICGADLAPNQLAKEVFIAGLADGEFPKRSSQRGFVSSDEVAKWATFDVNIQNPRFHPAFEFALFNSLVQRAESKAYLSCPLSDMGGEELTPSFFLTEGDSEFEHASPAIAPFTDSNLAPLSARDLVAHYGWKLGSQLASQDLPGHPEIENLRDKIGAPLSVALARANNHITSSFNGYLTDYVKTKAISVAVPLRWSASKLNEYGKCPFRYWVSQVLKSTPHEEPEDELDAKAIGEMYHKALEFFYIELQSQGMNLSFADHDTVREIFDRSVDKALVWLEEKRELRRGEFWHYQKNELKFRLQRFFEFELTSAQTDPDKFAPTLVEAKFGFDGDESYPPLLIQSDSDKPIAIFGKIDRIDVAENMQDFPRIRVVDYKKGSSPVSDADVVEGRNIQLPLYALAVEQSILPGAKAIEAKYLSVQAAAPIGTHYFDGRKKRRTNYGGFDETPVNLLQVTEEHVKRIVSGISAGNFTVAPTSKSVCTNCDHRTICRIKEMTGDGADVDSGGSD
ncbi:MAG: exodeoxyribonuclease V subunit gamma [Cyanobacteria bacterium SZAS-4]|nr:exodeoxyribonuclease V subunit gamma [Cyanobacteria bacterium SZAS-4]